MKNSHIPAGILMLSCLFLAGCHAAEGHTESHAESETEGHAEGHHGAPHTVVVTNPVEKDVISTQQYVCQIHSRRHIEVCALEGGYLQKVQISEGQAVKQGDVLFEILPTLYQAKLDSEAAEALLAQLEYNYTKNLSDDNVVSPQELALSKAKLAKAQANAELARAELNFASIKAPFDGIVDRQYHQQGSLIEEGDILTTLSDNDVMWVYFNVPESRYLEYKAELDRGQTINGGASDDADNDGQLRIELVLANGNIFDQPGHIAAVEADFNNETGNIAFRADFPNPSGLLRHGQTGTVLIHRQLHDAIVIPQRATYEILAKQYVYVVDEDDVVHQREIVVENEMEDVYVIADGVDENDRIIFEGVRQVRDGDKVEYEFRDPADILANLKHHAE